MFNKIIMSIWFGAAAMVLIFAFLVSSENFKLYYSNTVQLITAFASAFFCYRTVLVYKKRPIMRWVWGLVGTGVLAWGMGQIIYTLYPAFSGGEELPYPSVAEFFFIANQPLIYLGLLLLTAQISFRRKILPATGAGILVFFLALFFAFRIRGEYWVDESVLVITAETLYIFTDPLLIAMAAFSIFALGSDRASRPWWFVIGGLVPFFVANILYSYLALEETYSTGHPLDVGWIIAFGFIALGAISAYKYEKELNPAKKIA